MLANGIIEEQNIYFLPNTQSDLFLYYFILFHNWIWILIYKKEGVISKFYFVRYLINIIQCENMMFTFFLSLSIVVYKETCQRDSKYIIRFLLLVLFFIFFYLTVSLSKKLKYWINYIWIWQTSNLKR